MRTVAAMGWLAFVASMSAATAEAASNPARDAVCRASSASELVRMRVFSPLVAGQIGASIDVGVRDDGCVTLRYPDISLHAGEHHFRLADPELSMLRTQVRALDTMRVDAEAMRATLAAKARERTPHVEHVTSDADIVEFVLADADAKRGGLPHVITWTGLHSDRLNHPDVREVVALAELQSDMMALADLGGPASEAPR